MHSRPLPAQMLLLPEIVDLPADDVERLAMHADTLARFGLRLERFGPGAVAVQGDAGNAGRGGCAGLDPRPRR
jgi:DNA mismatch repair protein MutL